MAGIIQIARKAGFGNNTSDVEDVFKAVVALCKNGEKVIIKGLGTFQIKERGPRVGRNPATGAKVNIPAKDVLKFKAATGVLDAKK